MEFDIIVPCWGIDMDCARPALRGWLSGLNLGSWAKHRTPRRFCMRRLGQEPPSVFAKWCKWEREKRRKPYRKHLDTQRTREVPFTGGLGPSGGRRAGGEAAPSRGETIVESRKCSVDGPPDFRSRFRTVRSRIRSRLRQRPDWTGDGQCGCRDPEYRH